MNEQRMIAITLSNGLSVQAPLEVWILAILQGMGDITPVCDRVATIVNQQRGIILPNGQGLIGPQS